MAKTADQSQVFLYDLGGETVEVAREHRDAFLRENPKAQGVGLYDAGGETFEVADSDLEAFRAANPTAERVHLFDDPGGETVEVSRRDIGAYIGSRAQQAQKANDSRLAETSKARAKERADRIKAAAQADLRAKVGENPLAPTTQIGHGIQDAAAGIAYALPRLAGAVADAVNPDPLKRRDVITGRTVRVSPEEAGYAEDPYRPGPAARLRDRIEASEARRLAESAPETKAGERARAIAGAAGGMGALALSGGAAAPLLAVETGAGAMQRQAANGATPAEQVGAFALGTGLGALATAAGGAPGRLAGRGVQNAALRAQGAAVRAGAPVGPAVTRAVVAGNAARGAVQGAADMAALRAAENAAADDPLLEGTGAAALGGALVGGAVRGVGAIPAARYIGSAAERAAAERGAAPTPPRGGVETPPRRQLPPAGIEDATLAPRGEAPTPPRVPAEIPPAVRVPDAVRGYVPPAVRELGDRKLAARRSAEEELAPAEVPQVPVDEVPPTVPPEARGGVETPSPAPVPAPAAPVAGSATPPRAKRTRKPNAAAPVAAPATPPQGAADKTIEELRFDHEYAKKNLEAAQAEWEKVPHVGIGDAGYREYERLSEAFDKRIKKLYEETVFTGTRLRNAELGLAGPKTGEGVSGVVVQKDAEGRTVYSGEGLPAGTTTRERMPEQKAWLADAVKQAAAEAPKADFAVRSKKFPDVAREVGTAFPERVRFQIPGDGAFTVPNEKHAIEAFGKDIGATLSPAGINAPKGGGKPSGRGLARVDKSAPPTFTSDAADKLLSPFAPKSQYDTIKQRTGNTIAYGTREMIAFVRGIPGAKDNKWKATADLSKIADFRDDLPDGRDAVSADVPTLLRDVREAGALVDTSKEMLEIPSEQKAREAAYARNFKYEGPGTVRLMQGADGKLFIAGEAADGSTVETGDMKGAREIGMFNPDYLEKALDLMARTGSGKVFIGTGTPNKSGLAPFVLRGEKGNAAVVVMPKTMPRQSAPAEQAEPAPSPAPSRGPALGDAATASPSLVGDGRENPAPAVTDTLGAPREGAAQKRAREDDAAAVRARTALVKWEAGDGNEAEMRACISELEGRSLYASARDLKAAMGEATPRPGLSTAGAHEVWPVAEPGALARVSMRDLVDAATALGSGRAPEVVKRLRLLHGTALGSYRLGGGPVTMRSDLWQLVDREERADLRAKAREQAAEELPGADPKEIAARSDELFDQFLDDAIRRNAQDDAPVAAQVLAHELGHWLDDLPDGLRGRGNILGRLASLKDYLATTLFKNPADALGRDPFLTAQERDAIYKEADKGVRRKDFPSQAAFEAARRRAREQALGRVMLERGLASAPVVRAELDDLIAWYRQSDHAPEYFQKGEEMFAEAFSAYLNYPMTARAKAPTFCDLLEAWGSKKGEIWKAVQELQRREPVFASTQGPWRQRFAERMRAATGAWYALENFRPKDLPGSLRETWDRAANYALAAFSGELRWVDRYSRILEKARTGRIRENGWGTREGAAAREAVHAYTHASTKAEAEMVRFRTQVLPVVEQGGATIQDFDVYLTLYRVANELLGADKTRGAMNLPNPGGLTPAAAKAELANWERTEPASFRACKRAQEIFAGIRRETVLSLVEKYGGLNPEGLEQILANDAYARFLKLFAPPEEYRRRAAQGEMRATSGIRRRELGDLAQNVSPSLATLLGDAQIMFDVSLNGARRDAVNLLRVAAPGAVRPARLVWNPARKRMEPEQINTPGWRTVVWLENGKPTGADVRSWAAYGLRGPQSRDPSVLDPVVDALEYAGRANSAAITFLSYTFGLRNPIRDRFNMARNLPLSQEGGAFEATFGPVPTVIQSLWSGMGRARETGEGSPERIEALLRALDAGALPSASFSGRSHRQDTAAKLAALFQAGADPEKFRAAADDVVRSLGIDPALLRGQKKTLGVLSPLLEKAAKAYTWLPSRLARTETNAKVAGFEAVRLAHPDWPEARVAEFVARSVGTPDPTAPSALAQIRGLRAFLPFYTMTYRGFADGYLAPWRDQAGLMALRLSSHLAWRFLTHPAVLLGAAAGAAGFGGGIVGALREAAAPGEGEDPEDVSLYKRGLAAVADALEFVGKCMAAVSPFDRGTGHQIPLWCVDEATKKYAYLQIPDAQEMTPIDAAFDYLVDAASGRNQMPAEQAADAVVNGLVPNVGVVPRSLVAATAGVDLGQGLQEVHRDPETTGFWESRAEALGAQWDIWTGRGWGALQWRNGIRAVLDDEEKTAVEKFLALPGVVNTIRPFLRVTNQGDAQTAKMIKAWAEKGAKQNQQDAKEAAKANLRIDARFERGEEDAAADAEDERIAEEAVERIAETGAPAGEMVRGARKRLEERRTLSPSERAIRALPRRQREEARERFGIPEPD